MNESDIRFDSSSLASIVSSQPKKHPFVPEEEYKEAGPKIQVDTTEQNETNGEQFANIRDKITNIGSKSINSGEVTLDNRLRFNNSQHQLQNDTQGIESVSE